MVSKEDVDVALNQKYQSNRGKERGKNIAHLIAKMDVQWAVNKLAHDFSREEIFKLYAEVDTSSKQSPLMIAALHSKKAVLAAFLNFYSSNIDMTELHEKGGQHNKLLIDALLHTKDKYKKTLTYYIVTAEKKCLGPFGTLLQFEEDYHIRNKSLSVDHQGMPSHAEKVKKDYLRLQACLQGNVGTCLESYQVLGLMRNTRNPTKRSIITRILFRVLGVFLFQLGLYAVSYTHLTLPTNREV